MEAIAQDIHWIPEITDMVKPSIHCVFLSIYTQMLIIKFNFKLGPVTLIKIINNKMQ